MTNELEIKISTSVEQANKELSKLVNLLDVGTESTNKMTKSASNFTKVFNWEKLYYGAKKFWNLFLTGVDYINEYTENLNLFDIVMGDLTNKALKFQNTMSESFGNNTSEQLYYQSMFQSLTESMGLQEKYAYIISENMTKMTYDISSLFNKQQKDVASALRSGLVGQTKPVRNYGMDITENSLQPLLNKLGIDRTVRELNQAEKQILRYLALLEQSTVAHGDMANTIESPSNQLRVFKNQLVECAKWFSALFIDIFAKALPYINGVLMVIKEVCIWIGTMFGIEISDYNSGIASYTDDYYDLSDGMNEATDSAKELKRQMLGFDQINNINEDKDGDGTNVSGGIDQRLLDAIKGYDNGMENVRMKATEIRDRIMEWLGFTKEIDKETKKVTYKLKNGYTNLEKIRDILISLAGLWGVTKILTFGSTILSIIPHIKNFALAISSLFTGTSSISLAGTGFAKLSSILGSVNVGFTSLASTLGISAGALAGIIAIILAVAGALVYAYNENDIFKDKVNELGNNIKNVFLEIYDTVSTVVYDIYEVISPIYEILENTLIFAIKYLYETIVFYGSSILDCINGTIEFISLLIEGDFKGAFESAIGTVTNLRDNWLRSFSEIKQCFIEWLEGIVGNVKEFAFKTVEKLEGIVTWIKELPNKFLYWFGLAVGTAYKVITETDWLQLGKNVLHWIIEGISDFKTKLDEWGYGLFEKMSKAISEINWIELGKYILAGIISGMTAKISSIREWGKSFLLGIEDALGIASPAKKAIPIGIYTVMGIEQGMDDEIPNVKNTALSLVDTLQTTFDKGMEDLSLKSAMTTSLNKDISNLSTYSSDTNIDYNMLEQASYNGFAKAIQKYGLVQIDVKQDKGSIVETAIEGINNITRQTGENPIDVW